MKKSKKINKKIKVNLGCGSNILDGFLNIDQFYQPFDNPMNFMKGNLLDLPLENNSVDYVICDQVLEHIKMSDVPSALFQIRRILKVGGRAVIIVPDFRDAVEQWLKYNRDELFNPLTYHFFSEVVYGNQLHDGEYHKTAMSPGYLNYALNSVGLTNHELRMYPANGPVPEFDGTREVIPGAVCRNAQLVAIITKTV